MEQNENVIEMTVKELIEFLNGQSEDTVVQVNIIEITEGGEDDAGRKTL